MNGESSIGARKVAFIERWPSYRVATIDRFHCIYKGGDLFMAVEMNGEAVLGLAKWQRWPL